MISFFVSIASASGLSHCLFAAFRHYIVLLYRFFRLYTSGIPIFVRSKPGKIFFLQPVQSTDAKSSPKNFLYGELCRLLFYFSMCFFAAKKLFVSFTTTPLKANSAIIFGIAIRPLKISAIVHTALTVMYGPIKTAKIYSQR